MEAFERNQLVDALQRNDGNLSQAAQALGTAKTTRFDKVNKYGLQGEFDRVAGNPPERLHHLCTEQCDWRYASFLSQAPK